MDFYSNTDFDGYSHADMVELGENVDMEGGQYYQALMTQQLAANKLLQQVKKEGDDETLTTTWDAQPGQEVLPDHHKAYEFKPGGVDSKQKEKRAEPTVRLRKAMGLPLRKNEPLFDKQFPKGLPVK